MTVYVDDMRAPFGRLIMCHMVADTSEELLEMADKIGVARKWIQYPNTGKEHFDIALSKRKLAVEHGAVEITWKELGKAVMDRTREWLQHRKHDNVIPPLNLPKNLVSKPSGSTSVPVCRQDGPTTCSSSPVDDLFS